MLLLVKSFKAPVVGLNDAVVTSRRHNANKAGVVTTRRHRAISSAVARSILVDTHTSSATVQTKGYKLHKLDEGPSTTVSLKRDEALLYYRNMQLIRHMSSAALRLFNEKKIRGVCHLYDGQEACAVGVKSAMDAEDAVITSYRCHPWALLQGSTVAEILSELTGRISGNVHGKGGSMHMYQKNFYGGCGIVGAQQSLGAGIAFAMKYRKQKNVCIALYGDGGSNQGQFFESTNMAYLWKIPVLYVCENNGFGIGTSSARSSASTDFHTRGDYVPGIWVDGMDVLAVREAIRWAKEYCDAGKGPLVLELATYRYRGHSMVDLLSSYRTQEEIDEVRKTRDPITGFTDRIINCELVTKEDLKSIETDVREEIEGALNVACTAGFLPKEGVYTDIYHNTPHHFIRGPTIEDSHVQKFLRTDDILNSLNEEGNFHDVQEEISADVKVANAAVGLPKELVDASIYHSTLNQLMHDAINTDDGSSEQDPLVAEDAIGSFKEKRPLEIEVND